MRVREQGFDSPLTGRSDEGSRVFDARIALEQDLADVVLGQRVEANDPDSAILRDLLQVVAVVGPEPVRFAAGQAEPGPSEPVELGANRVERCAAVR